MELLLWLIATLVGCLIGSIAWYWVGFQAVLCFVHGLPKAINFWRRGVLTSWVPIAKYLALGIGYSLGGYFLGLWLWGLWNPGFRIGLIFGVLMTLVHSLQRTHHPESWYDFVKTSHQYLDWEAIEEEVEDTD
ncbi:hypothetical protein [Salinibacter sp.]|uniref:hypothetical protein n=1 Tax=Salinibacter sp. TaxID=2065818 RepID=UPI0021E7D6AB|nr:hypothetical protein [Salinibacter sp.]